ncbi:permease-like cell division protein FtsX [Micromonospora sp. WMMD1120]|uniref:permease-like cell division protein FtsX n=1 Tax=Micromonospora sp. WMMD1120 TaxID=3016106 RepID=UPI002417151A|nr:permease-like cell division protein FtsX [Micromonospora sp. WMMD1120]MDG4809170.1 permease-like cell division protein FtsX [Micromonospora sp. WMMD1120]
MDQNLRVLFDRAMADEPEPPAVDLAGEAMAAGTGLRRRRQRFVAAGAAAVAAIAAAGALNVATPQRHDVPPPTEVPAAFGMLVNRACEFPAREIATHASVFLTREISDQQRTALDHALEADPAVATVVYESREEALARFRTMYRDAPDLVAAVRAEQMPESFRVTLTGRSEYAELAGRVEPLPGVDQMYGIDCPAGTNASVVD